MLVYMKTNPDVSTLLLALHASTDPLRLLAAVEDFRASTFSSLATAELSPVRAATLVQLAECGHRISGHGRIIAARAAQHALVHELDDTHLSAIDAALEPAGAFAAGTSELPAEDYAPRNGKPPFRDATEFLHKRLNITYTEARNRIAEAGLLLPGTDDFGQPRPARFPVLGSMLGEAKADPSNLASAARKLAELSLSSDRLPDGAAITAGYERAVAESVRTQDARGTRGVLQGLEAGLEPLALDPSPEELHARQGMFFIATRRGLDEWKLLCTAEQSEVLLTCFDTVNNPRLKVNKSRAPRSARTAGPRTSENDPGTTQPSADTDTEPRLDTEPPSSSPAPTLPFWFGTESPDHTGTDPVQDFSDDDAQQPEGGWEPSTAQRRLTLLITACRGELDGGYSHQRPRNQVVVSIDYRTLLGQLEAAGRTAHGANISPLTIRRMACDAEVIPILMGTDGQVLDLGRSTRKFPTHQRLAIAHRDRGCVFPGCSEPPEHCEVHHLDFWRDGGVTSVDNGTLLCVAHHHLVHLGDFGLRMIAGIPYAIPPTHQDPLRRPLRNTYWYPELIGNPHPPGGTLDAA